METLANILAGVGTAANPYQVAPGLSNLISQQIMAQQMAPMQLGGQISPSQIMPQGQMGGAQIPMNGSANGNSLSALGGLAPAALQGLVY